MTFSKGAVISLGTSSQNDENNLQQLFPDTYRELQRIAHFQMKRSWDAHTMQTTALVNETYLKLSKYSSFQIEDKRHFFAICASAMRQILVNYAEQKYAQKRGGHEKPLFDATEIDDMQIQGADWEQLFSLDQALKELQCVDEKLCQLVELRYFVGLTEAEQAEVFGVSERTIRRDWVKAKALLSQALKS